MMLLMKRLLPLAGLCVLLAACGGSATTAATCEYAYWDGTVGTCLPAGWHVVDRDGLDQKGVPRDVVVAFQADAPSAGQFPTVTVTKEPLARPVASDAYSAASLESVKGLPGYGELDTRDVTIDDVTVKLHIFSAQPRPDQPRTRFYQVSAASGNAGYTYTAATPLSVESGLENEILLILNNATLRKAAEATK